MVDVSNTYNPYSDIRKCGMLVTFEMIDVDAASSAVAISESQCELSQINQTHDRYEHMDKKYATLEENYFLLDGTFKLPTKEDIPLYETGWWSKEISNENREFQNNPILFFAWNKDQSSAGLTIHFDDLNKQYATDFIVRAYDKNKNILGEKVVENKNISCEVDLAVENYRYLEIEILKTNMPFRRARIIEVIFGMILRFEPNNTVSASIEYGYSPSAEFISSSEFVLTMDNSDAAWNMSNPKGVYNYLQETMPMDVWFTINDEKVFMGRYYFTSASAEDNAMTAKIVGHDKVYWLDSIKYQGGENAIVTFENAINGIVNSSNLDIGVVIPEEYKKVMVRKTLAKDMNLREAIRTIAQAVGLSCFLNREGNLEFVNALNDEEAIMQIGFDKMHSKPKITVAEKINKVTLSVPNEYEETVNEEVFTADDSEIGDLKLVAEYENSCVYEGDKIARWLLDANKHRLTYSLTERGNPAFELNDNVEIKDAYGGCKKLRISKMKFSYNGGLSCQMEAWG